VSNAGVVIVRVEGWCWRVFFSFSFFFFSSSSSHLVEHTNFVLAALRAIGVGAGVAVV
jgi:hypothetical protein